MVGKTLAYLSAYVFSLKSIYRVRSVKNKKRLAAKSESGKEIQIEAITNNIPLTVASIKSIMNRHISSSLQRTTKCLVDKMRPPVHRCTRLMITASKPYIKRSSEILKTRLSLSNDNAQQLISRKLVRLVPVTSQKTQDLVDVHEIREQSIPLTKKSIVHLLIKKERFLTEEEKKIYEDFALALDSALANKYHHVLQELKALFDPINPDKDTLGALKLNPRERQDSEFWLLQRLDDIAEKANFHELPRSAIDKALATHDVQGVQVSVDTAKYDVLKFWVLGHKQIPMPVPWYKALFTKTENLPKTNTFYKRVILATRLKCDQKLMLKSFKDIPVQSLEMLLPDGKIQIPKATKAMINICLGLAGAGVLVKFGTLSAGMTVNWTLIFSCATGSLSLLGMANYLNRRIEHQKNLFRLLYLKNIANNSGLLTVLVDRAKDEFFKETLLVYTFLLTSRARSMLGRQVTEMSPSDLGGITLKQLQDNLEKWVWEVTGSHISIQTTEALQLLQKFGLLSIEEDRFHVLALKAALRNLPQQPQSIIARETESDILEGYDRDVHLKTVNDYVKAENKQKRYGWF